MLQLHRKFFSRLLVVNFEKQISVKAIRYKMDHLDRTSADTREKGIYNCNVTRLLDLSNTVKMLSLDVHVHDMKFKPGQWVDFFIPNVSTVGGFSICSSPRLLQEKQTIHLAVKKSDHPPAAWVHNQCQVGSQVQVRVGGDFYLSEENSSRPLLLLAGGVGINPLLSMLLYVAERQHNPPAPVVLLYSTRTLSEQIFVEQIQNVKKKCPWLHFEQFVTRDETKGRDSRRIEGNVITHTLNHYFAGQHSDMLSFLCGPSSFIDSMEGYLMNSGLAKENILYEKWW